MRKLAIIFAALLITAGCVHKQTAGPTGLANTAQKPTTVTPATSGTGAGPSGSSAPSAPTAVKGNLLNSLQAQLQNVYFDFDKYNLKATGKQALKNLSSVLAKNANVNVAIQGNCDERGTAQYNLALGDKRANAAKDYLVALGVNASRISTISYGSEKPVCKQKTESCYAKNRRDNFVLSLGK